MRFAIAEEVLPQEHVLTFLGQLADALETFVEDMGCLLSIRLCQGFMPGWRCLMVSTCIEPALTGHGGPYSSLATGLIADLNRGLHGKHARDPKMPAKSGVDPGLSARETVSYNIYYPI
jgi:hypothetical protein